MYKNNQSLKPNFNSDLSVPDFITKLCSKQYHRRISIQSHYDFYMFECENTSLTIASFISWTSSKYCVRSLEFLVLPNACLQTS